MTGASSPPSVSGPPSPVGGVPAPPGTRLLRVGRSFSVLVPRRVAVAAVVLTVLGVLLALAAFGLGSSRYSYGDAIEVLGGGGSRAARLVILEWRIPRIVLALSVGSALGMAGSIFQALTRNPLGSPDLIGFTMGAQTGILVAVFFGAGFVSTSLASLIGGVVVGALIFLLSLRGGFGGLRLILAGIAVTAMLGSVNRWLILRTDPDTAYGAVKAVTGSLASADAGVAMSCTIAIVGVGLLALLRSRDLRALDLGQDLALSLGTRLGRARTLLVLIGAALVALATMAAGPIAFVALAAPHAARLLTRAPSAPLSVSAAMGALMLLAADVAAQTLWESLPVGTVTAAVGGVYLLILLISESRTRTAP